ncbi:MAG: S8 family serine peptidase, partial [Acidobacteria bacterium]|nr:S8 family serine peptidase [Acidobacteriota bacterium]
MSRRTVGIILILIFLGASLPAVADDSKLSPELRGYNSSQPVQVIVQYSQSPQTNIVGSLLGVVGTLVSSLPLINSVVALVDANGLVTLSNDSNVVYVSPDRSVKSFLSNAAPAINAPTAWKSNYTGSGVAVAVVDSGISSSPDLNSTGLLPLSRIVYGQDFVGGDLFVTDSYGHGTHVAGLIAGDGLNSTGSAYYRTFKGIAPSAKLVNLRVLDANGAGT